MKVRLILSVKNGHNLTFVRCCDAVERPRLIRDVCVEIRPELDEEEGLMRTLLIEVFKAALLFGELVLDLPDVNRLGNKWTMIISKITAHQQGLGFPHL